MFFNHIVEKFFNCKRTQGCCNLHWEYKWKSTGIPWRNRTSWLLPANLCRQLRRLMLGQGTSHRKWWRCRVLPPDFLKSLNRADSSHACRHSFLADDDLNPFLSSRTARIRHPWIGAYLNFHLFDGWRHAISRLSELSLCLTTYPNSGFFRWHRSQTRLRVRTLRSQLLMVDFIKKPFDRLLHASTVSTPSRI